MQQCNNVLLQGNSSSRGAVPSLLVLGPFTSLHPCKCCTLPCAARASKPAASKTQPSRRKPAPRSVAGAHPKKHPAKRPSRSSAGSGAGAPDLASVLYGSRWRVDGGLKQQQQQLQRIASEGGFGTDYSRCASRRVNAPWLGRELSLRALLKPDGLQT